jgi:hypothetical protein
MDDAPRVALRYALMPALLPVGDEFRMNFEALGTFFRHISCFAQHFCELGVKFVENVANSLVGT